MILNYNNKLVNPASKNAGFGLNLGGRDAGT